jgi:hypothetical protein
MKLFTFHGYLFGPFDFNVANMNMALLQVQFQILMNVIEGFCHISV